MKIKVVARKYEGDDAYSWAVFRSDQRNPVITGLGQREAQYYKKVILEKIEKEQQENILTKEQIDLGAKYLAMSNLCTLDRFRKSIKDMSSLERAVRQAWEDAVTGYMESQEGGYDDKYESAAIRGVEDEISPFLKDLKAGGEKAKYWIQKLKEEIPFLFTEVVSK